MGGIERRITVPSLLGVESSFHIAFYIDNRTPLSLGWITIKSASGMKYINLPKEWNTIILYFDVSTNADEALPVLI